MPDPSAPPTNNPSSPQRPDTDTPSALPKLIAIAAMAANRVIGRDNKIPWHLPEDFRWFRERTLGHTVLMGRGTFDSIGRKPFPERRNIILTRNPRELAAEIEAQSPLFQVKLGNAALSEPKVPGSDVHRLLKLGAREIGIIDSLEPIYRHAAKHEVLICGGANVYAQTLPRCGELLLSRIKRTVDGDAFFPAFEQWFDLVEVIRETPEFVVERWRRRSG